MEPRFSRQIPAGDVHERDVCESCGFIDYVNPRILVGSVVTWEGRYLLCRGDIEPRRGFWTLPAGYMEVGETAIEGAKREAWEEARAKLSLEGLLAVYDLPHIAQVQLLYRGVLLSPEVEAAEETSEVGLFAFDEIPWEDLAFPTVHWALNRHHSLGDSPLGAPATNPVGGTGRIPELEGPGAAEEV